MNNEKNCIYIFNNKMYVVNFMLARLNFNTQCKKYCCDQKNDSNSCKFKPS